MSAFRSGRRRGNNIIEFSLLMPWYVFLFAGAFDYGFYAYSLIATQDAARVAALYCSTSSSTKADASTACTYALGQLQGMANVTACSLSGSPPLSVTASSVAAADGSGNTDTSVTVTYTTPQLIPVPGLFPGKLTIARTVQMRVRS